jgi:hypothetical protein
MKFRLFYAAMGILLLMVLPNCFSETNGSSVKVTLNGADLAFDADTGALLQMSYPGVGPLLEAAKSRSSISPRLLLRHCMVSPARLCRTIAH